MLLDLQGRNGLAIPLVVVLECGINEYPRPLVIQSKVTAQRVGLPRGGNRSNTVDTLSFAAPHWLVGLVLQILRRQLESAWMLRIAPNLTASLPLQLHLLLTFRLDGRG